MPLPVVENFTPITFHRFSRQIPWTPLRIANEHSFPITNITVTLSLNVYKKKMTIRPFVSGFVLLISKKIRVEIMRRGGLIMNDILKRFCWLDDKMTAGIVRRSFYRLGVISAFCDRARRSRRACSRASSRPPRGPALLARLPPRRRRCRRRCCSPARQGFQKPPASAPRIPPLPPTR